MLLKDIVRLLEAAPSTACYGPEDVVEHAGASDLMSDVLAFTRPGSVLLTGLTSIQVIRTAEMLDLKAIVFVRNKRPDANAVALAEEMGLPLFVSPYPLYEACGILMQAGLPGCQGQDPPGSRWERLMRPRKTAMAGAAEEATDA